MDEKNRDRHHVVIIGGGFGGLYAAKALGRASVKVTVVDKRNFHLFQPLLYQVATGGLSPGDIASPLRSVLNRYKNIWVLTGEVTDIDPDEKKVVLSDGELTYDTLIVATGVNYNYFGNDEWKELAPGPKTIEDTLDIRRRIFLAFEAAEREQDTEKRRAWMTFVVVGGGPTGVELAGALAELAHSTLKEDFRNIDPKEAKILLLEGTERILPAYPPGLAAKAEETLTRLGVTVLNHTLMTEIAEDTVTIKKDDESESIGTRTVLWAAGVKASPMGQVLAKQTRVELDRVGRALVEPDLTIPGYDNIFVIGDLANFSHQGGQPLPGTSPVAMQQGKYTADLIKARLKGKSRSPFHYRHKGSLAVIGRNAAVADFGFLRFSGFFAWLAWIFIHIIYLIEYDNKIIVLFQWAWNYFTRKRGARLITGKSPFPLVDKKL